MSKKETARGRFWQTAGDFVDNAVTHNVVLAQGLGLCPIIAAGVTLKNGVALTVCTAAVMLPLSLIFSVIGWCLEKWLRPIVYVLLASLLLVGAAFVTEAYISPELYAQLYLFIPLLSVNMLYSRSLAHTNADAPWETITDALGSTVGFGFIICLISLFREMAISGSVWGHPLGFTLRLPEAGAPFSAFILLGFLSALLQWTRRRISAYFRHKEETNS